MNTDNQWATFLFSFQVIHEYIRKPWLSFKMFKNVDCIDFWVTRSLASFKMFKMSNLSTLTSFKMSFDVIKAGGPIYFQIMFMIDVLSTSRHVTSSDVASYRRCGHVISIDRSQSHHRIQMWCQMLINCTGKLNLFWFQYQYA